VVEVLANRNVQAIKHQPHVEDGRTCRSPTTVPYNVAVSVLLPKLIQAVMPPAGGSSCIPQQISD
jgi:hypothetical protein